MVKRNSDTLLKYLTMITKNMGGPEEALQKATDARAGRGLESMAPQAPALARSGMEALERGREAKPEEIFGLEAIINADLRPAVDVVDGKFQLPDVFFTKDRKAFDKGHVVRRDDVAWGRTYDILRRANGDTYHVTNCSPQVAGFNRSAEGEDNWGDLENHVLSEAVSERLCVFAGPVLAQDDEVFTGKGDGGAVLRAKIPQRFWKVIVARVDDGLAAYGFVLEQDLSAVDFEFIVPEEFQKVMTSIADIEAMTGVVFEPAIRLSDQFDTDRGAEIALRAGARRKRREG